MPVARKLPHNTTMNNSVESEVLKESKSQMKEVSEMMKKSLRKLYRGLKGRKGQSLVEYALILALIAVVAILVLKGIGTHVNTTLESINSNLP